MRDVINLSIFKKETGDSWFNEFFIQHFSKWLIMSYKYATIPPSEKGREEKAEEAEDDENDR